MFCRTTSRQRYVLSGGRAVLWLLLTAAILLAHGSVPPARAQSGHFHNWLPYTDPCQCWIWFRE